MKVLSDMADSKSGDDKDYEGRNEGKGEKKGVFDAKREALLDEYLLTGEEEDLGLDMRKLIDDIRFADFFTS